MEFYGTLGPACANGAVLRKMFENGMTGLRLNLSHTSLAGAAPLLAQVREIAGQTGVTPQLLIDMQGPELRIGGLERELRLVSGSEAILVSGKPAAEVFGRPAAAADTIPVPEALMPHLRPGAEVHLDDGKIRLEILPAKAGAEAAPAGSVRARVLAGGVLKSRKSIAAAGADTVLPAVTAQDIENLRLAKRCGVTGLMQPFVRSKQDLLDVRRALRENGCGDLRIFAKIENGNGLRHLEEIIGACDEIVIARGDLGNNFPLSLVPVMQKEIAAACRRAGRPFMVVTQMLSSMERAPVPSRADVSDIFNAVLDGAASLMVTNETAVGSCPAAVIDQLVRTAKEAAAYQADAAGAWARLLGGGNW